jgi:antitoxin component of MazEF toxin-antitoxin module
MLQKKLTKVGNSYALILDKPLMDMAGISANEPVVVSGGARKRVPPGWRIAIVL